MNANFIAHDSDELDCLDCKRVTSCPCGQAVAGQIDFSRLQRSCSDRSTREPDETIPSEIEQSLLDIYGPDQWSSTREFEVFMRIHTPWGYWKGKSGNAIQR